MHNPKTVEINSDAAWEYLLSLSIAWRRLMQLTWWEGRFLLGLLPCTVAWNKETRRCYFEEGTWRIRNPQHHANQSASWQTTTNIHKFHRDSKPSISWPDNLHDLRPQCLEVPMTLAKHANNFAYQVINRPKAAKTIFSAFVVLDHIYMIRSRVYKNTSHEANKMCLRQLAEWNPPS